MKSVYFGVADGVVVEGKYRLSGYDSGTTPNCALNRQNQFVEVHKNELGDSLYYWCGTVVGTELTLTGHDPIAKKRPDNKTPSPDSGYRPSVAINNNGVVVEAHDSGESKIWWWLGQAAFGDVTWTNHAGIGPKGEATRGYDPAIAINDSGVVVEIHMEGDELFSWVGRVEGDSIAWNTKAPVKMAQDPNPDSGAQPSVAINNAGVVLEVHSSDNPDFGLWYWLGQLNSDGNGIEWLAHGQYDTGVAPSVALADDGSVVEVHSSQSSNTLYQRIGKVDGSRLTWADPLGTSPHSLSCPFDWGANPSVAFNGAVAVQVHETGVEFDYDLYATASLWTDRANWMTQYASVLGERSLKNLVMPASHDSSMFLYAAGNLIDPKNWSIFGKTQAFNYYQQLSYGVRYFDLRPDWDGSRFIMEHAVNGATLEDLIEQVQLFYMTGGREVAILKFSHYGDGITQDIFERLCIAVRGGLGQVMYSTPLPAGTRLADTTLSTFTASGTPLIVVFDNCIRSPATNVPPPAPLANAPFILPDGVPGLWIYRDWYAADPQSGDLTVFDVYSDLDPLNSSNPLEEMAYSLEPNTGTTNPVTGQPVPVKLGQLPNFTAFDGRCLNDPSVPCDLFLLSWTLTPPTAVYPFSRTVNKAMGYELAPMGNNMSGRHINLLYADYVQDSRATDIALVRNGCVAALQPEPVGILVAKDRAAETAP